VWTPSWPTRSVAVRSGDPGNASPVRPIVRPCLREYRSGDSGGEFLGDAVEHEGRRLMGAFFPGEDAGGGDAVEVQLAQGAEERGPVDLALADVEVLVDAGGGAGAFSSQKSSGWASRLRAMPSRSKRGSSSSSDRQNAASLAAACSGPLNSEFIRGHSRSEAISIMRFQRAGGAGALPAGHLAWSAGRGTRGSRSRTRTQRTPSVRLPDATGGARRRPGPGARDTRRSGPPGRRSAENTHRYQAHVPCRHPARTALGRPGE
jgi:hypothetical protein